MSYRKVDKDCKNCKSQNYNKNIKNLDRNFPSKPTYCDPNLNSHPTCNTNSSNEIRININNNFKLNLPQQFNEYNVPVSMNKPRTANRDYKDNTHLGIIKPDENPLSIKSSKQNLSTTENLNKRRNELSMEEALKLSASIDSNNQPEKKIKVDRESTNYDIQSDAKFSKKNRLLKELEAYGKESAKMGQEVNELLDEYRGMAKETMKKFDAFREKKIQQKTMKAKMKKICRAIEKEDDSESDSSGVDANIRSIGGEMNIGSVVGSSDSSDGSDVQMVELPATGRIGSRNISTSSSTGSDVLLIAVDESGRRISVSSTSSSSDSDSHNSDVQVVSGVLQQPPIASNSDDQRQQHTAVVNGNTANSDQVVPSSHEDIKESPQTRKLPPTSSSALNTPIISSDSFAIEKSESKINIKNRIPECVDTSFMLETPQTDLSSNLHVMMKADGENGLFHAIEPKLNTIIISDEEKTFITDIKVFNNRLFASASHGLLRQYHLGTHECIMDYKGHQSLIHCLLPTVHPVGVKRILSGGFDKTLFVHDIDSGAILQKIENDSAILSICDQLEFVYYGTAEGKVATFSLEKDKRMSSFRASDKGISCLTATKEGNVHLLFVGANTGEYSVWNAITYIKLKIITPVSHLEIPIDFIVLQKQRLLAYTRNNVHFIQYVKTKSTSTFNHFDSISSLCLTRNYVIIGGVCGKVSVYKIKGSCIHKTPIRTITNSNSPVVSLTFYNNTIITGDKTGKVYFNRLVES